jgi:hypothetical protein
MQILKPTSLLTLALLFLGANSNELKSQICNTLTSSSECMSSLDSVDGSKCLPVMAFNTGFLKTTNGACNLCASWQEIKDNSLLIDFSCD